MDFPAGSITNVHVIDEFSDIYWRIYTEEPSITNNPPEASTNGYTILKHLSRLKDLELRLRNLDCLVSCYPRRLGLWVFSPTPDFGHLKPFGPNDSEDGSNRILIGSSTLKASASGNISSADLVKNLSVDTGVAHSAGSQRSANNPTSSRRLDGNYAAIYASFITAITGTISLQLVRRNGAVPLGSRTLFTAVEKDGYSSPIISNDSPTSIPSLTTLQIQLTPVGKLTILLQTIAQLGIARLQGPWDQPTGLFDADSGTDLWLSPNGTIARLVTANPDSPAFPSPIPSGTTNTAKRIQWKSTVIEWLENYGLPVRSVDDEIWVEVEVWEPFYAKLAGDAWRQNGENQMGLPLKRILWPARYCFKRTRSTPSGYGTEGDSAFIGDPVEVATHWYQMASSAHGGTDSKPTTELRAEQPKGPGASPPKPDFPEGMESLSRIAEYPDLQSASLVYPTPPDGPVIGLSHLNSSDAFGEDSDIGISQSQQEGRQRNGDQSSSKNRFDPDVTMDFGPSAGLVVGSGLYDTNDDDDLFGEMNGGGFESKGITDADFNFFDDPDFGGMEVNSPVGDFQETPIIAAEPEAPKLSATDHEIPESVPRIDIPPEHTDVPQADPGDTPAMPRQDVVLDGSMPPPTGNSQTISPPLSPVEIKKILFPSSEPSDRPGREGQKQNHYHYSPVAFDRNMSDWDQKYGSEGKFKFSTAAAAPVSSTSDIPTIGIPSGRRKVKSLADISSKVLNDDGTPSSGTKQCLLSDSSSSSGASSEGEMNSGDDSRSVGFSTLKRKRARSNSQSSAAPSFDKLSMDVDQEYSARKVENSTFLGNFLSIFSDWPLTGYFSASQNQTRPVLPRKEDQVQIAQLLADQVTQSSVNHNLDARTDIYDLENQAQSLGASLEEVALMGEAERLDLKEFSSLQDSGDPSLVADGSLHPQAAQQKEGGKGLISKISPPHLRVRRGKDYLEALPPVVSFWETFGIEPAHGPKDVSAYCIHPHNAAEPADTFLESFGLLYSSCNLGAHVRGARSNAFKMGLASWDGKSSGASGYSKTMQSLKSLCQELGAALLESRSSKENIVVYIINPFTHAAALTDICAAFWHLFQTYVADVDKQQAHQLDELVLQVIPMSFLASTESIVVPSQAECLSLALEVYSRCPPRDPGSGLVNSAPPTLLAESLPKNISFTLTAAKLSPLLEGRILHVACSRSLDQRWITAAWVDNTGSIQHSMSYCLRLRHSKAARSISDIRKEIWAAAGDIMDRIQARWRVVIVTTEPLDQEEMDTWPHLAEQHNKARTVPIELVILSANTTSDLYLEPPPQPIPMSVLNAQPSSTPVTTPNHGASAPSPDQPANSPTPASGGNLPANAPTPTDVSPEAESESVLTDIYDESWVVVLSHRLNCSSHLTEYRPALASGYLLRRKGPIDGDGVFSMTTNLVYTQRPPSAYETLLRDTLKMYRDLATLARARGTYNVQHNTLPWHIAAAVGAQEVLSYVL